MEKTQLHFQSILFKIEYEIMALYTEILVTE